MAIVGVGSAVAAEAATSNVEGVSLEELQRIIQQQQQVIEAQQKRLEALEKKFEEAHPQPQKPAPMDTTHVHKEVVRSGFNLKFYGFLRGDLEGDTRRMNFDTQLPFYVLSPADPSQVRKRTGDVTFHPRLTRFGFDLNPPKFANGWTATAKLETDFFNAFIDRPARPIPDVAAAPNNPFLARDLVSNSRAALRVRHAYVRLQKEDLHILMGQTWDVISPLYPSLNADTVMWNAGNTADRRPQLRIGYEPAIGQGKWSLVGMVGSSGAVDNQDLDGDGFRDGEAAVSPTVQGRVGYSGPSHVSGQTWSAGVYGHLAHQNVNRFFFAGKSNFGSHLLGVDLSVPLTSRVRVQGEGWTGQNLSDVRGGIGQGIDLPTGREVRANGGWLETSFRVNKYYLFNLGATLDRPNAHDLTPAGARILNRAYYITNRFSLGKGLSLGFDYANWQTRYKALPTGTNNRFTFYIQNDF
jgi:uncharacterized coiled-coil protein SlyX